jgi:GTPase SAR1 family protein
MSENQINQQQQRKKRYDVVESNQSIDKNALIKIQEEILKNDPTEFIPADIRNVLFCGASRSGKSTIFHVMQNPVYSPEKISIFSDTKFTSFKTFTLRDRQENRIHNFVVSLIDTPGTFELRSTKEEFESRSNDQISDLVVDCINHEVTYLNLLCLVVNAQKFSETEMDSIDLFLNLFGKTSIPILLCLTHADEIRLERREEIILELKEHPRLTPYFNEQLFKIQWMGCVNMKQTNYVDVKTIDNQYKLVANWRDEFMDEIFNAKKRVELDTTDIYKNKRESSIALLSIIIKEMDKLIEINTEVMTGGEQLSLLNHSRNMNYLFDHSFYLEKERDLTIIDQYRLFLNFCKNIQDSRKPETVKQALLGKWYK